MNNKMTSKSVIFLFGLMAVSAFPRNTQRIMGGSPTTIREYPEMASLLYSHGVGSHRQSCGGAILTRGAILTAAHCTIFDPVSRWRSRLGSTFANSGGVVYHTARIINHRGFLRHTGDNDIAIIHVSSQIRFSATIRPGLFAGASYFVRDGHKVWAAGWGATGPGKPTSEQLRHVKMWVVNQDICRDRYVRIRRQVTDNMLCAGWLDVGGRDQCGGDSGGPLYHNGIVVGLTSWGYLCGTPEFPGVNTRVQRFADWILKHVYIDLYEGDLQFV